MLLMHNCWIKCQGKSVQNVHHPGKSYKRGRLSTVDLLVLTSLDQLLSILKILFTVLKNKS